MQCYSHKIYANIPIPILQFFRQTFCKLFRKNARVYPNKNPLGLHIRNRSPEIQIPRIFISLPAGPRYSWRNSPHFTHALQRNIVNGEIAARPDFSQALTKNLSRSRAPIRD